MSAANLISNHKRKHFTIEASEPKDALRFLIKVKRPKQQDSSDIVAQGNLSNIFADRRKISATLAEKLGKFFGANPALFIPKLDRSHRPSSGPHRRIYCREKCLSEPSHHLCHPQADRQHRHLLPRKIVQELRPRTDEYHFQGLLPPHHKTRPATESNQFGAYSRIVFLPTWSRNPWNGAKQKLKLRSPTICTCFSWSCPDKAITSRLTECSYSAS